MWKHTSVLLSSMFCYSRVFGLVQTTGSEIHLFPPLELFVCVMLLADFECLSMTLHDGL